MAKLFSVPRSVAVLGTLLLVDDTAERSEVM
jgi:hypothetical protein